MNMAHHDRQSRGLDGWDGVGGLGVGFEMGGACGLGPAAKQQRAALLAGQGLLSGPWDLAKTEGFVKTGQP